MASPPFGIPLTGKLIGAANSKFRLPKVWQLLVEVIYDIPKHTAISIEKPLQ
jgi:hypothetical protein